MSARVRPGRKIRGSEGNETYNAYIRARNAEMRARVQQLKKAPCTDCQNTFPPCCMDYDHVRGIKSYTISGLIASTRSWSTILTEIAKCDLVCANCHRIRTYMRDREKISIDLSTTTRKLVLATCHPGRKNAGNGLCNACYKAQQRGPRYCDECSRPLPRNKAKLCSPACVHARKMKQQRNRRRGLHEGLDNHPVTGV